ncbi:hypothetical protein C8R47DRAFT_1223339 [Mycena vitilis]|nr:hypothetical protein C8R47DRAFT_1223339 [Mycena vitilis]
MSASGPSVVTVDVAADSTSPGGAYSFSPSLIAAPNGTVVSFRFSGIPGNHSVTQSTLVSPCHPLEGGFDSGFIMGQKTKQGLFPTFNYTVTNDQAPTWFYCRQQLPSPHCRAGMVGVINGHQSGFTQFQDKATSFATISSSTSTLPVGAIVGIVLGALLLLLLLPLALLFRCRRLRRRRDLEERMRPSPNPLIASEKGPMPQDDPVSLLSSILREMRSLRGQMRGASTVNIDAGAQSTRDPPPKYTVSL